MLLRISDVATPSQAWETFEKSFSRKNTHQLQLFEKEIGSLEQGFYSISENFLRMKRSYKELSQLNPEKKITDTRGRLLINGLRQEYEAYVAALAKWKDQPSVYGAREFSH